MTQKKLIFHGTKKRASSRFFPNNIKLSTSKNSLNNIKFEYHYQQAAFIPDGLTTQIQKVIDYINNNFQKDLGLAELASLVGLSSRYFSELFKTSTGYSPFDYLLKFRLYQASLLLLTTNLPIFDIARRTGFSSSNNFCRAFRKYYSISPNRYRESHILHQLQNR